MRSDKNGYYSEEDFEKEFGGALNSEVSGGRIKNKKVKKGKNKEIKPKRSKGKNSKRKTAIIVIACILAIAVAGGALAYSVVMNKLDSLDQRPLSTEDLDIDPQVAEDLKDYQNILLIGIDARDVADADTSRTDAIIIISIHKPTKEVKLISVYRDTYLDVESEGESFLDKINHAHAYDGPVNTIRALNRNMDLNIESYMRVNWETVADIVDGMGGLTLDVQDHEVDELNTYLVETNTNTDRNSPSITGSGEQLLDGAQAVTYCRIRGTDGDEARTKRMRNTISAAFDKAKTLKLSELDSIANEALPQVTTSMSSSDIMKMLLSLNGYKLGENTGWPYNQEGTMIDGVSYSVPVTLESNVSMLHEEVFGQKEYVPTERVLSISEQIINISGLMDYGQDFVDYNN